MSQRVKNLLAGGKRMEFGELYEAVSRVGPATKFAVRSALSKGRERGDIGFAGGKYYAKGRPGRPKTETPAAGQGSGGVGVSG